MKKLLVLNVFICLLVALGATPLFASMDGGKLIVGRPTDAVSLDAATETTGPGTIVYGNITETLITLEADGSYKPRLAAQQIERLKCCRGGGAVRRGGLGCNRQRDRRAV